MKSDRAHRTRRVSARRTILVIALALALSAVLVPLPMHRPLWLEIEAVLVAWWVVWTVVLAWMLYAGIGLRRDFLVSGSDVDHGPWWRHLGGNFDLLAMDLAGFDDLPGCLMAIAAIALLGLLVLAGWILLEVVFPLVIPLAYGLMLLLLTRVVHRQRGCRGHLPRAIAFGAGWASLYTLPLVVGTALVHLLT